MVKQRLQHRQMPQQRWTFSFLEGKIVHNTYDLNLAIQSTTHLQQVKYIII